MSTLGYLLDTNVASALWDKRDPKHTYVRSQLALLKEGLFYVSAVTLGEVEFGLRISPRIDKERHELVREAMSGFKTLDITRHTATTCALIKSRLFERYAPRKKRGRLKTKRVNRLVDPLTGQELGIQYDDLWIVATAADHELVLITTDKGGCMERVVEAANYRKNTLWWDIS